MVEIALPLGCYTFVAREMKTLAQDGVAPLRRREYLLPYVFATYVECVKMPINLMLYGIGKDLVTLAMN